MSTQSWSRNLFAEKSTTWNRAACEVSPQEMSECATHSSALIASCSWEVYFISFIFRKTQTISHASHTSPLSDVNLHTNNGVHSGALSQRKEIIRWARQGMAGFYGNTVLICFVIMKQFRNCTSFWGKNVSCQRTKHVRSLTYDLWHFLHRNLIIARREQRLLLLFKSGLKSRWGISS